MRSMKKHFTLSYFIVYLSIIVLVSSCTQPQMFRVQTITPSPTLIPEITLTPSPTPTATFLPITPVISATQAPDSESVISAENADRLTLFARWGNGNISDAQYTPDGEYLVATSSIGIYFYSAKDYSFVKHIDLRTAISEIAFTKDGQKMAVASLDSVSIFNQGENQPTVTINEAAYSLAFSPNGQILALGAYSWPAGSGFRPEGIKLFDSITGKMILEFKDSDLARTIEFSPDGSRIAAGGYTTQMWNLDGKLLDTHGVYVSGGSTFSLSFSPDGTLLAEGADTYNVLHVWRVLNNGKLVIFRTISLGNYPMVPQVFEVEISPDGKLLAAATSNGLSVWQLDSGALIYRKNDNSEFRNYVRYYGVAWSTDSKTLATISEQSGLEIWNMSNGELFQTLDSLTGAITALAWQPNEEKIASGADYGAVFLIDSQNGNILNTFEGNSAENNFAFSSDGNWLAIKSNAFAESGGVVISKLTDDAFHHVLEGSYGDGLSSQSFSSDGRYLVTSGFDNGKRIVQIWNTENWSLYTAWKVGDELVGQLIFCPDGETIALVPSRDSTIKYYRIADGSLMKSFELSENNPRLNVISFSPNGQMLLTMSRENLTSKDRGQVLRMWETDTGTLLYSTKDVEGLQIIPPSPPYYSDTSSSITWSPDGELFAAGFSDGIVGVYRAGDGKLLQTLSGHTMMVMGVAFSPNGQLIASASLDGTIRVWGVK